MKKLFSTIVLLFVMISSVSVMAATKDDNSESYNLQRGIELMQEGNYKESTAYFVKEISEHPKNSFAYLLISMVQTQEKAYGKALESVNKAIQYTPSNDKEKLAAAYNTRADIYNALGDRQKMLADLNMLIKLQPNDADYYQKRAQFYYEEKQYDLSANDYNQCIRIMPGSIVGYMGLGRNACMQGRYDEGIRQFEYAMKLSPDYSTAYAFRADAYSRQGKFNEALDDCLTALRMDYDRLASFQFRKTAESAFSVAEIKLKAQIKKTPSDPYWYYMLASINEDAGNHKVAVQNYLKAYEYDADPMFCYWAALESERYGNYKQAIDLLTRVYDQDSTSTFALFTRATFEERYGLVQESLRDYNKYIEEYSDDADAYYMRGWLKDKSGLSMEEAIEDYTTAIALNPDYTYSYLCRGQLYRLKGDTEAAGKDFETVLKQDTVYKDNEEAIRQYALFYLGRVDEAKAWQDSVLKYNSGNGIYYDAACLYSLMGETSQSLSYLRTALEKGFFRFAHIRRDIDLDNIHGLPEFEALMQEYEKKYNDRMKSEPAFREAAPTGEVVEIPFSKEYGICKVNCAINGLPLYFVFDTGASDVCLSQVEANFMMKNQYLSAKDVSGKQYFQTASGDISEGTVIMLREVDFGGVTLKNVKASVVRNQKAPLLLGQSVLSRLGSIEIDNENKVIKVRR
jgi:clan AA aspartic protease (TIGR02281 family)